MRRAVEIEIKNATKAEREGEITLQTPIDGFPSYADFEQEQTEQAPAECDRARREFEIQKQDDERGSGPGVGSTGERSLRVFAFRGPAGGCVEESGSDRDSNQPQRNAGVNAPRTNGVEIDGRDLNESGNGQEVGLEMELETF